MKMVQKHYRHFALICHKCVQQLNYAGAEHENKSRVPHYNWTADISMLHRTSGHISLYCAMLHNFVCHSHTLQERL